MQDSSKFTPNPLARKLTIDWMSGEPAPKAVFELLSGQCKRVYQLPSCTCLANGLYWTDMCQLQECTNQPEEATEDLTTNDSDIECEDDFSTLKVLAVP